MSNIDILDLGIKDYKETLEKQYELIEKVYKKEINNTLIFVEHPHVITLGRKAKVENILDKTLPIYNIERGGDVTYHGFGQLVGYPIFDYNSEKDIGKFLRNLEQVIIDTLEQYNIKALRKEKHTGVWLQYNSSEINKKIASIGISFKNWISYHGFALNVSTDLSYFFKINPCGLESQIMTNMEQILDKSIDINDVKEYIYKNFLKYF
ncbi:MAG: lipoyl(octanoyl) transferase LipB [Candidatus Sericytochromatia bacterium]